ncbi:MAG TPA: ElyC/SanA/YdcF family protein [Planctomycetota bacterium]|nr:ElyC/SanA/YdcF family protein [Planctomycetota bacterium]
MRLPRRSKQLAWLLLALTTIFCASVLLCDNWVARVASGRCFESVADVPEAPVALVLGCSEHLPDGRRNLYFARRIAAAAELFHANKVEALIVSGDNHCAEYDEPGAMKAALVAAGVPEEKLVCDFAGFRTLDSVVRARRVFGQNRLIVVSQRFHCERAVFLARAHGIEAFGLDAAAVGGAAGLRTRLREAAARTIAALDVSLLGTEPKFLGPPVEIGGLASTSIRR